MSNIVNSPSVADSPTVITGANIPDWFVADTVDLSDYVAANPHRTVIRIFAREVTISAAIDCRSSLSRPPLDLRVDCQKMTIKTPSLSIDVSGSPTALGWKTYAPGQNAPAQPGERGFDAGNITLNILDANFASIAGPLNLIADGGPGGNGQDGYPGWPGDNGKDGVSYRWRTIPEFDGGADDVVTSDGSAPTNGSNGSPGTDGAPGGDGGRGGIITIRALWDQYGDEAGPDRDGAIPIDPFRYNTHPVSLPGGKGGRGGAGGAKGTAGAPSVICPSGNIDFTQNAIAADGKPGADGHTAADGAPTIPSQVNYSKIIDANANDLFVYAGMDKDALPNSLRTRTHLLFDKLIADWVAGGQAGSRGNLLTQLSWLNDLAQPDACNYPEIVLRYAELQNLAADAPDFAKHRITLPASSIAGGLAMLSTANSVQFAADHPTYAAMAANSANADIAREQMLAALTGESGLTDIASSFYGMLNGVIAATAASVTGIKVDANSAVQMTALSGTDGGIADEATCTATAAATVEDVCMTEAGMGPEGIIASAVTGAVFACFSLFFGGALGSAESAQQKAFDLAVARHAAALAAWENAEKAREQTDLPNALQYRSEVAYAGQRARADKRDKEFEEPVLLYGTEFIGVLTDTEVDSSTGATYAILDGFLLPVLSSPVAIAAYIKATYRTFAFLLTVRVPPGTSTLTLGDWYAVTVSTPVANDDSTLETGISFWRPGSPGKGPILARGAILLPPVRVTATRVLAADPLLSKALDFLFQYTPVPNSPYMPPGLVLSEPGDLGAPATVTTMTLFNVGQGTFHLLGGQPAAGGAGAATVPSIVIDMGGSSSNSLSVSVTAAIAAVAADPTVPVIMSHWDQDHYRALDSIPGLTVQSTNRILGASYFLKGPVLVGLLEAIASHGANHLYLVGSEVANVVTHIASVARQPTLAGFAHAIPLPGNVWLTLTTRMAATAPERDRNNTEAIVARLTGVNSVMLMPGDASFTYILATERAGLTMLEATHHGSSLSILTAAGGLGGVAGNNDIPVPGGAVQELFFSTGHRYGHGQALTGAMYASPGLGGGVGWTTQSETIGGDITRGV